MAETESTDPTEDTDPAVSVPTVAQKAKVKVAKPLTKAEEKKKAEEAEKKAVDSMWKAAKNDDRKNAETAISKGFPINYADPQVRSEGRERNGVGRC